MAAVLQSSPPSGVHQVSFRRLENPRTFLIALSREKWRALPLAFVVTPTLDGPVLAFPERRAARAEYLQLEVLQLYEQYRCVFHVDKQKAHAARVSLSQRIRRKHLLRVALAVGYTWPGNPPGHIEFAPDE